MAEENKNAAPDQEFNDDGKPNPDYVKPDDGGEGGEADPDNKDGDDSEGGDADPDDDEDDSFNDDAEPDVPVRNSAASHIIARKNKKIKKLESKQDEEDGGDPDPDKDDDDDDGDKGVKPEDLDEAIDKKLKPMQDKMISDADEAELKTLLKDEPDAVKYEKHIRAYMEHAKYAGVPPSVIFHHLAFTQAQALGAKKQEAADAEADQGKGGGRDIQPDTTKGTNGLPTAKAIEDMSEEEFAQLEADALQGKFVKK